MRRSDFPTLNALRLMDSTAVPHSASRSVTLHAELACSRRTIEPLGNWYSPNCPVTYGEPIDSRKAASLISAAYSTCQRPGCCPRWWPTKSVIGPPNVRLGIIPLHTRLPIISMHGFTVTDDEVTVEINHTEVPVTDPEDVVLYERITEGLWSVAVEGGEARGVLASLAANLSTRDS
jgi:hypothetical protein